jgi:hypothetical protein
VNIWVEFVFVLVRAGLVALGTLLVQHGWISQTTADNLTGPAAVWITAGAFVIFAALGQSVWSKIKAAAAARLALMFPAGSSSEEVRTAMTQLTRRSLWFLAKHLASKATDADRRELESAFNAVRKVVVDGAGGETQPRPVVDEKTWPV